MISKESLEIASRVVALRKAKDISQAELARKVGLTKGSLSQFERGLMRLSAENLGSIAKVLFTSTDYLIWGKEDRNAKTLSVQLFEKFLSNEKVKQIIQITDDKKLTDLIDQMKSYLSQAK